MINANFLIRTLPVPSKDTLIINMGPKGMNDKFAEIIVNHTKYDPNSMVISKAVHRLVHNK